MELCSFRTMGVLLLLLTFSTGVSAQDGDQAAAAAAFARAQEAELRGDHARAADHYELADRVAPTPQALRAALRTRIAAGHLATAAAHADDLLRRYATDERSREIATAALAELGPQLVRYRVACDEECRVTIDGQPATVREAREHIVYAEPGEHQFTAHFESGASDPQALSGEGGGSQQARFVAPPYAAEPEQQESTGAVGAPASEAPPPSAGISIGWFIGGLALTLASGGTLIWSGIDTTDARAAYAMAPTWADYDAGKELELRTNVLIVTTAALGITTALLAVFTDWGLGGEEAGPDVVGGIVPTADGFQLFVGGTL